MKKPLPPSQVYRFFSSWWRSASVKLEGQQLDALREAIEYDSVLNIQREIFYRDRQIFLMTPAHELRAKVLEVLTGTVDEKLLSGNISQNGTTNKKLHTLRTRSLPMRGSNETREHLLSTLDDLWTDYLTRLEKLRQGIGLRAYSGQRPLQAYQVEAYKLWNAFQAEVKAALGEIFN